MTEQTIRSPLHELSLERFKGGTFGQETVTLVQNTRVTLLPNNPNRLRYSLINEGANDVRISIDATVSTTSGWLVVAGGGVLEMDWESDGEVVGYTLYAISPAAAGSNIRVLEVIRE